ncbi:MAG TPA: TPM domain-containing protein [Blastocatellia bacterium]|jgi:uncharacterized protein|nr:TPM domain-containing protein [Blastocatellia bacterium]
MMQALIRSLVAVAALFFLTSVSVAQPKQFPAPTGMVNDFAGKLSPDTKQGIENLLNNFRDRSGVEVVVVTVNYADLQDYPIEDYTLYLGRQWGVGRDSQKRALLLLVAIQPPDAQGQYHGGTRLEVSRHLEGDIPDGLAGEIIRKMRDDFRGGNFDRAISSGTQTILATLATKLGISMEGIDARQAYRGPAQKPRRTGRGISPFMIIVMIFVFLAIIRGFGGGGGPGGRYSRRRRGIGAEWMLWPIIFGGGRGGFGGGGGWGGGSSDSGWGGGGGGGFGGFGGGGDFGGGGASDSW